MAAATDQPKTELVLFRLANERFAVPLDDLDQVACVTSGVAVAHASSMLLGLTSLRGEILPLLDTAALLGTGASLSIGPANRTLIVRDRRGRRSGLPVDGVIGVKHLSLDAFRVVPGPKGAGLVSRAGVTEQDGEVLTLIDLSPLQRETLDHF
jgi:purine-binding chemotaxis protein CheW